MTPNEAAAEIVNTPSKAYSMGVAAKELGEAYAEAVCLLLTPYAKLFKAFIAGFNGLPDPSEPKMTNGGPSKMKVVLGLPNGNSVIAALLAKKLAGKGGYDAKSAKLKQKVAAINAKMTAKGLPWLQLVAKISTVPTPTQDPYSGPTKEGALTKITKQEDFVAASEDPNVGVLESLTNGKVGQRIAGTNPGAIYYLIGVIDGLNVAARWKGAQLSVRIAGPKLAEYRDRLKAAGVYADHTTYFSAHMGQQGAVDGAGASLSAQMLYASILASVAGDVANFTERAPYEWRNWLAPKPAAAPAAEAPKAAS